MTVPFTFSTATSPIPLANLDANFAAVGASDNITYTAPFTGAVAETVEAKLAQVVSVKDFGAVGDGTTDDTAAFNLAIAVGQQIFIPYGTYVISDNLTFSSAILFEQNSIIKTSANKTIAFNKGLQAGVYQIFDLGVNSTITIDSQYLTIGYPEWWGAVTNGPDCLSALEACIAAVSVTLLQSADYVISDTLKIQYGHKTIKGHSKHWTGTDSCTRIVLTSGTKDVVQIGYDTNPGVINDFLQETTIDGMEITRSLPVVPPSVGNEANAPSGIRVQFTLYTYIYNIRCSEHSLGFNLSGAVQCHLKDCFSFRSTSGTTSTNDIFWGYFQNGNASIGAAGGNASTYYTDCNASVGGTPALSSSIGWSLDSSWVDTFIFRPEVATVQYGFVVDGSKTGTSFAQKYGNADLHIIGAVLDQIDVYGILIQNSSDYGTLNISDCYVAMSSSTSNVAAYAFYQSNGMATIQGCEAVNSTSYNAIGLYIYQSSGIHSSGNRLSSCKRPVVLDGATNCRLMDTINNPVGEATTQAAVYVSNTSKRNYIAPIIMESGGGATTIPKGIEFIGTSCIYNEVNCTGIDPSAITGGSGNKLVYNSTQITSTGTFGTNNLASGIMG